MDCELSLCSLLVLCISNLKPYCPVCWEISLVKYPISSTLYETLGQKHSSLVLYHLIMRTVFPPVSSSRLLVPICDFDKIPTRVPLTDASVNSQVTVAWSIAILFPSTLQLPTKSQLQALGFFSRTHLETPKAFCPSPYLKVTPMFFTCYSSTPLSQSISALLHLGN